jgi:hypothetical protein
MVVVLRALRPQGEVGFDSLAGLPLTERATMAAKNAEQVRKDEVDSAIRSLRELIPNPKYGECQNIVTALMLELTKQINARREGDS